MTNVQTIVAGAVSVALAAAVVALGWHGVINGQAAIAFFGVLAAGFIGAGAHAAGTASERREARRREEMNAPK